METPSTRAAGDGEGDLEAAPKIKLSPVKDARSPYPLTPEEQALLFQELPDHLARMALYKVNTGCREQEVCRCGGGQDLRDRVPQKSRNHLAASSCEHSKFLRAHFPRRGRARRQVTDSYG